MNRDRLIVIVKLLGILICLYLFVVGINGMSHSFKLFGKGFADTILKTTSTPIVSLFIGILATALVQSSSTTTSIIVGMVAGGALTIEGAIPMIMGANIGTTITNLLVSLGHITRSEEFRRAFAAATVHDAFNWLTVLILFPLEMATGVLAKLSRSMAGWFEGVGGMKLGNPLKSATKPVVEAISKFLGDHPVAVLVVSIVITFAVLYAIVKLLRSLVLERIAYLFDEHLFRNAGRAMLFGLCLTIAVQSSSITTSLVIPLAGAGILRLTQILPYTLGANVGTTTTAILAALATQNTSAITVAFAHLLFNLAGIGIIWPVKRIRMLPIRLAEWGALQSQKNRLIPIVFILGVFFGLPLLLIAVFK